MSLPLPEAALAFMLFFCRLGAALVLLPGLANPRFPRPSRVLFALATTLVLTPFLQSSATGIQQIMDSGRLWQVIMTESLIGFVFGFWCYCFLHATRFAGAIIVSAIGLAGIPGQPIDEEDPTTHLGNLLSLSATILILATDLHLISIRAIAESYQTFPLGVPPDGNWIGENTISIVSGTSTLALQVASPFLVLAVVLNLALGFCSKFTPQLQVYFAILGLTILLSLSILAIIVPSILMIPVNAYASWLDAAAR